MTIMERLGAEPFGVVAHRGGIERCPENTLAAIQHAIELGVDVVEVDVRLTADGELVLLHDPDFRRVAGMEIEVRQLTLAQIKERIRIGDEPVATLDEALELVDGRCGLFVEIKEPETTETLLRRLQSHDSSSWCAVISFWDEAVKMTKEAGFYAGLVYSKPPGRILEAKELGADLVLPHYRIATQKANRFAHALGMKVVVWTVNEMELAKELMERGVDGIATDYPDTLLRLRSQMGSA